MAVAQYCCRFLIFFFFNDTATTEIYTLSLHDALPISLAALEWTAAVGILSEDDLIHAARLGADAAAAHAECKDGDQRVYIYFGPRMDAPPADPYEGTLLHDEPVRRAYILSQPVHAIAHF